MAPTIPAPAEPGPMLYGRRKYQLGMAFQGQQVIYDFDDDTCKVEIRYMPDCDSIRDTMRNGSGRVLASACLECGDYPDAIEIEAATDPTMLDLLRKSIEWLYADERDSTHRKVLRMFYTRVRAAQV